MGNKVMANEEVIFEITKDHLETGMRGIPVGYCTTSSVDPQKGLHYMGQPVSELANWGPEEVMYLLYHGKKASDDELKGFCEDLKDRAKCHPKFKDYICALPREGHPMALFSSALMIAGMLDGKDDYREDCLNLMARIPEIAATVINHHAGWGDTPESKPELGYMENFTHMVNAPNADKEALARVFRLFNVLHYDHGGGNLSTFVGKAIASGKEDLYGSLCGAMNALAGPLHGRANQDCLVMVQECLDELGTGATPQQVEAWVRNRLNNKELIYGFGHAVLRVEDPRATVQYAVAQEMYPEHAMVKVASLLRSEGVKVLKENPKVSNPYPNVDAISGTLLTAAGFPYPEYYTVLFGTSRCVGIAMQIVYERLEARGGKGTPIVRPKYLFKPKG